MATDSGMMLNRWPPWTMPTVTTTGWSGCTFREAMVWSERMAWEAMTTGSTPACGCAPWVCTPVMVALKWSTAASAGPGVKPITRRQSRKRVSPKMAWARVVEDALRDHHFGAASSPGGGPSSRAGR